MTLNRQTLLGLYWKDYRFWRQDRVYYALCCSILSVNKIYKQIAFEITPSKPYGESVRNFCEGIYFRPWFWLKRCSSHSKWLAVYTFAFLQIFVSRRLIRELILTVCSYHVTYAFQSESTLYSCLNVKELLARSRHEI